MIKCKHAARRARRWLGGRWTILTVIGLTGLWAPASLSETPEARREVSLIASPEAGWPQWRGLRRDGISAERGLSQSWPEGGPPLLWKTAGLGQGYSGPVISGGKLFLAGDIGDSLVVSAFDLMGKRLWQATNGSHWRNPYPGARASCVYASGKVFHLNAHGRICALEAATGKELWAFNLLDRFGGKVNTWAFSECLLVDGSNVIVTPGGQRALMAALDARTGATVWQTEPLRSNDSQPPGSGDIAGYASPILANWRGQKVLISCSSRHLFAVDAAKGKLLATRPMPTEYSVIAMSPTLVGDAVFITAPFTKTGGLIRLREGTDRWQFENVWLTKVDTCNGGAVALPDGIFASWYQGRKGYVKLDPRDGQILAENNSLAKGAMTYADGRLYALSEDGTMNLLSPESLAVISQFHLVSGRHDDVWTHPVILDQKLYLRHHDTLWCYDIRRTSQID